MIEAHRLVSASAWRYRLVPHAERLAVALAISLPWSTSATSVLAVAWLLTLLPTLDGVRLRSSLANPAGGLPVMLWALGLVGLLWSSVPLAVGVEEWSGGHKLLMIPLFIIQFRRSDQGGWVLFGYLASCTALLALSWVYKFFPGMPGHWSQFPGVPVKDYVVQSGEFLLCAYGLGHLVITAWRNHDRAVAIALSLLAFVFLANVFYVATSRAMLVVLPFLVVMLGWQRFGWKGAAALLVAGALLGSVAWASSPYLRGRVIGIVHEVDSYETKEAENSSGYRLEFWKKSIEIIAAAPFVGHGSGSVMDQFRQVAVSETGLSGVVTDNPHNQTLSMAIQFGLIGVTVLFGMWLAHLLLFRATSLASWLGLAVVVQNIVASFFNSQLFYFAPGWTYVLGVGVLGGTVLGGRSLVAPWRGLRIAIRRRANMDHRPQSRLKPPSR